MTKKVLIAEGEYEVFIEKAKIETFKTGTKGLKMHLRIRNDVEQRFSNFVEFDTIFLTDSAEWRKNNFLIAIGLKEDEKDVLNTTLKELPELVLNKQMRITIGHQENNYKGVISKQSYVKKHEKSTIGITEEVIEEEIDWEGEISL